MSRAQTTTSLPPAAQECLRRLATAEGFFSYKLEARRCKTGNLSTSHEVTLRGSGRQEHYFTKCIPAGVDCSPFLPLQGFFLNEWFLYSCISLFEETQYAANVPVDERFTFARCYSASTSECLVLENLASKGYMVTERRQSLSLPVARLAVKRLAQFHALNLVVARQHPGFFSEHIKGRTHLVDFEGLHRSGGEAELYDTIELITSSVAKAKVKAYAVDIVEKLRSFYGTDVDIGVLCHGDYRGQNLMTLEMVKEFDYHTNIINVNGCLFVPL